MKLFIIFAWITTVISAQGNSCSSYANSDCGIAGRWKNQLNSTVVFACSNGQLRGRYRSAVGAAEDFYVLTGRYTMTGPNHDVAVLGWVVAYNNNVRGNSNSTASWSGIYYPDEGKIHTQWILTRYTTRANLWQSSWINHDEFVKDCTPE